MRKLLTHNIKFLSSQLLFMTPWYDFVLATKAGKNIQRIVRHPLISGSGIIFFGSLFGNIFNFLFNVFMSRNLSFSDYGDLVSLFSITTLFSLPVSSVIPTIIFFSATYFAANNLSMVKGLYIKITKMFFLLGLFIFMGAIFYNGILAAFFHISHANLLILGGFIIFLSFLGSANYPLLQAQLAFGKVTFLNILSSFLKFSLGALVVIFGFSVGGVMWALIISTVIPYIISFAYLRFLFVKNTKIPHISLKTTFFYGTPAALATFGLVSLTTVDIVLVKHFFSPREAGIYAMLSLVGKVIYYFSAPISSVMFPLITQKHTKGENYHNDLLLALALVFFPSMIILAFYAVFPSFIVSIFSPSHVEYSIARLIIPFGIFTSLFGLLSVLINFYLSINKVKVFIPILFCAILQAVLLWFFHASFLQVILISVGVAGLLLFMLLLYYGWIYGKKTKK